MTDPVKKPRRFQDDPLLIAGMTILLARNGGELTWTEAEYQEVARRWGGTRNFTIQASVILDGEGKPRKVQVELVRRPPGSKTVS
jgi:hypothetical protein